VTTPRLPDFEVRGDATRIATARRWNAGIVAVALVLLLVVVLGGVGMAATGFGSWVTLVLAGVLGVLCLGVLWTARSRTRMLALLAGGDGVLRADDTGIRLPGLGEIRWDELVFVCVTNHRARTERLRRVPFYGWAGRAAIKAGNGTILCELAVLDGVALRARAMDAGAAGRVTLYPPWPDGRRRGTVPLLVDAVFDEWDTQAIVKVLFAAAAARGIPHALFEQLPPAMRWKGPYLDDVIAGARPARG